MIVSGTATLAGRLDLQLAGSFEPVAGQTFKILTASGGVVGDFSSVHKATAGGVALTPIVHPFDVSVLAALLGDMDRDHDVDFDDIGLFVLGLGDPQQYEDLVGLPPSVHGDLDSDGDQDFDDIGLFADRLTGQTVLSAARSTPEPPTAHLLLGALLLAGLWSRSIGFGTHARSA